MTACNHQLLCLINTWQIFHNPKLCTPIVYVVIVYIDIQPLSFSVLSNISLIITYSNCTVVTCPTRDEYQPSTASYLRHVVLQSAKSDLIRLKVNSSSHRVHNGLRLLKYLLFSVCIKAPWPTAMVTVSSQILHFHLKAFITYTSTIKCHLMGFLKQTLHNLPEGSPLSKDQGIKHIIQLLFFNNCNPWFILLKSQKAFDKNAWF